jgi:hypothetical protein
MEEKTTHQCQVRHKTYPAFAKCAWKRRGVALDVQGNGAYASVSECSIHAAQSYQRLITVHLQTTADQAESAKRFIDETGCGGRCTRKHTTYHLVP